MPTTIFIDADGEVFRNWGGALNLGVMREQTGEMLSQRRGSLNGVTGNDNPGDKDGCYCGFVPLPRAGRCRHLRVEGAGGAGAGFLPLLADLAPGLGDLVGVIPDVLGNILNHIASGHRVGLTVPWAR